MDFCNFLVAKKIPGSRVGGEWERTSQERRAEPSTVACCRPPFVSQCTDGAGPWDKWEVGEGERGGSGDDS